MVIKTAALVRLLCVLSFTTIYAACGGGGGGSATPTPPPPLVAETPDVTVSVGIKQLTFSWEAVPGSTHYKLLENADGGSGFTQVGPDIAAGTLSVTLPIAVHFQDFAKALYIVQSCDAAGCSNSSEVNAMNGMLSAIGYFKASNTGDGDQFGWAVALSADGRTVAVGASDEESNATGIDGDQGNNSLFAAGAVYLFRLNGDTWLQQAYVKASNTEFSAWFGKALALSADGDTLVVGAPLENSNATGINGDQNNDLELGSGAAYVFRFDGTDWAQQAYVKASNNQPANFGSAIALSDDGNTLVVGSAGEESNATGINGNQADLSASASGAAYLYRFDGMNWFQQAYVKASNTESRDRFGSAVALSSDGDTLAVGAYGESSNATGIDGDQNDNSADAAGAAYVFRYSGTDWAQQAYIKAANTDPGDEFGVAVALSADGSTLAVGANREDSNATGINGDQNDNSADYTGAAYVFRFESSAWLQEAYVKASNTSDGRDSFGEALALSADGDTLVVGARLQSGDGIGVNGSQSSNGTLTAGAAYVFLYTGTDWAQQAYVKAPNPDSGNGFGGAVALSADGNTLAVGANGEESNATGVGGNQSDNSGFRNGAAYLY